MGCGRTVVKFAEGRGGGEGDGSDNRLILIRRPWVINKELDILDIQHRTMLMRMNYAIKS